MVVKKNIMYFFSELFYVRNHLPVPDVDPNTYELEIEIEGKNNVVFTLDQLKRLPKKTITATIMCAGNRRSEMTKVKLINHLTFFQSFYFNIQYLSKKSNSFEYM